MNVRVGAAAVAAAVAMVGVGGCGQAADTNVGGKATTTAGADTRVKKIGDVYTYPDKVALSATSVTPYKSEYPEAGKKYLLVTVKVVNGSAKILDTTLGQLNLRVGKAGTEAQVMGDPTNTGWGGSVAPGAAATVKLPFAVATSADTSTASVQVSPTIDHALVIFTGPVTAK